MIGVLIVAATLVGFVIGVAATRWWTAEPTGTEPVSAFPMSRSRADVLDHELERARRYERTFAMIRIPVQDGQLSENAEAEAEAVFASFRTIDVSWIAEDGIDVLLPEVGRDEAEACIARMRAVAPQLAREARLAVFPDDGLTRGALLELLEGDAAPGRSGVGFARIPRLAT